jgi:flagellar hook-length control protein FliK
VPSINSDKPLNLPADPVSVSRPSPPNSDSSDSFDDHLQRLAPQPPDNKSPAAAAQNAPVARPSASSTNSGDSEKKKPATPVDKQDPEDSAAATQHNAPTPVATNQAATLSAQIDTTDVGQPHAATTAKPNVKPAPAVKNNSATPQQPAPAGDAKPVQAQTDKQIAPQALVSTDPQKAATPEAQKQATSGAQQPAAANPQTQAVASSAKQVDPEPQTLAVADTQKPSNASPQAEAVPAPPTQVVTDAQQEVAPAPPKPMVVDSKKAAAITQPANVPTPATAVADEPQPAKALDPDQPPAATAESAAASEVKPARETAGSAKKGAATHGNHDATDPAGQSAAAAATRGSASVETTPASEGGPRIEGDLIAAPTAAANHSAQGVDPQSSPPIQAPAITTATKDSMRGAPPQTAAASDGTSNISDVDRVRFVQRVSRALQTAGEGTGTLRLRLSPPELGPVRLEVSIKDGVMSARLEAETPAAKAALLDNYPKLQDRLAEQNIKLERFEVNLSDRSGSDGAPNQSFDNAGSQRDFGSPTPRPRVQTAANVSEPAAAASALQIVGSDQLNVVI